MKALPPSIRLSVCNPLAGCSDSDDAGARVDEDEENLMMPTNNHLQEAAIFELKACEFLSKKWGVELRPRAVILSDVLTKKFDLVSED